MTDAKLPKNLTELRAPFLMCDKMSVEIIVGLHAFFNDEDLVTTWLLTKNLNFGDIAPLRLIQMGRGQKVLDFIITADDEGQTEI